MGDKKKCTLFVWFLDFWRNQPGNTVHVQRVLVDLDMDIYQNFLDMDIDVTTISMSRKFWTWISTLPESSSLLYTRLRVLKGAWTDHNRKLTVTVTAIIFNNQWHHSGSVAAIWPGLDSYSGKEQERDTIFSRKRAPDYFRVRREKRPLIIAE